MRRSGPTRSLGGQQVEGHHAVHELLASGRRRVERMWLAEERQPQPVLAELAELARHRGVRAQRVAYEELEAAAATTAHQGVIAWAEPVAAVDLTDLLAVPAPFVVVLDGVTDPGNFGSVLRSAACAGATGIVVAQHRSAPLTPAAVKSAAGAVEHVPIALVPGIPAALAQLSKAGVWTVGLAPEGGTDLWSAAVLDGPVALVLGSEGRGLSTLSRQRCDLLARIRQVGPLGSLNVAVAAAVACFEVARRRSITEQRSLAK